MLLTVMYLIVGYFEMEYLVDNSRSFSQSICQLKDIVLQQNLQYISSVINKQVRIQEPNQHTWLERSVCDRPDAEVGIYKKKQESKKERKHAFD